MRDMKGKNVGTITSYLKGAFLLLQNYSKKRNLDSVED